jgi:hypothetical protein
MEGLKKTLKAMRQDSPRLGLGCEKQLEDVPVSHGTKQH